MNDKIIERIQKLLSLANSPNEEEAKSATNKANELLLKYNLSMQSVKTVSDYVRKEQVESGLTLKPHHDYISDIVMHYFFVKVHINNTFDGYSSGEFAYKKAARRQFKKSVILVGTKHNVRIASYIFEYLEKTFPLLWKDKYERDARLSPGDRRSYYAGLKMGIESLLEETKWRVQEETGLVLVDDPELLKFSEDITKGKMHLNNKSKLDPKLVLDGYKDGKNITLRKPIESQSTSSNVLELSHSDTVDQEDTST